MWSCNSEVVVCEAFRRTVCEHWRATEFVFVGMAVNRGVKADRSIIFCQIGGYLQNIISQNMIWIKGFAIYPNKMNLVSCIYLIIYAFLS